MPTTGARRSAGSTARGRSPGRPSAEKDYSGTPLSKKLGIREGSRVVVQAAPAAFELSALPDDAEVLPAARRPIDVVLLFTTQRADLERRFPRLASALASDGRLWVAWPKKASAIETDLTFDAVQRTGLDTGLVDNKSASITDDFQGVQFVVRLRDRPNR